MIYVTLLGKTGSPLFCLYFSTSGGKKQEPRGVSGEKDGGAGRSLLLCDENRQKPIWRICTKVLRKPGTIMYNGSRKNLMDRRWRYVLHQRTAVPIFEEEERSGLSGGAGPNPGPRARPLRRGRRSPGRSSSSRRSTPSTICGEPTAPTISGSPLPASAWRMWPRAR